MKRTVVLLLISIFVLTVFIGCTKSPQSYDTAIELSDEYISEEGTLYHIKPGEETIYLTAEQPDVVKIIKVTKDLATALGTRGYDTMDGREGYEYLSEAFVEELEAKGDAEGTVNFYTTRELIEEIIEVEVLDVKFNQEGDRATVKLGIKGQIIESVDWHRDEVKAVDDMFTVQHYFGFILTESGWKVYTIKFNV